MIFNQSTLNRLKRLQLIAQQVKRGAIQGERRSTKRGQSIEFADYRNYTPGDDLRRLDWNVYARTDKPFIKLMEDEQDLAVTILLDASRSMDWGAGDENKLLFARRLAAGLGVISLFSGDLLAIEAWGANTRFDPARGQGNLNRILRFLTDLKVGEQLTLTEEAKLFASRVRRTGLVFLISDLLYPDGLEESLKTIQQRGHQVVVLHILTQEELTPQIVGDLRLVDSETNNTQEVSLTPGIQQLYQQRVSEWQSEIHVFCKRRRIQYFPITTNTPWDEFILYNLRREGLAK